MEPLGNQKNCMGSLAYGPLNVFDHNKVGVVSVTLPRSVTKAGRQENFGHNSKATEIVSWVPTAPPWVAGTRIDGPLLACEMKGGACCGMVARACQYLHGGVRGIGRSV